MNCKNKKTISGFLSKTLNGALIFVFALGPLAPLSVFADTIPTIENFSTPGITTWTVPANVSSIIVKVWGAGGSAGSGEKITDAHRSGLGGGAGGYTEKLFLVNSGEQYTLSVGSGGQDIKSVLEGRVGNEGTESKFEGLVGTIKATGGIGGTSFTGHGNPTNDFGFGGVGEGGDTNLSGANADPYIEVDSNPYASNGGSSPNGGNGGSRGRCGRDGTCSGSELGSDLATDGGFPGGGGGGSDVGLGGYGANGQIVIQYNVETVTTPVVTPIDIKPVGYLDNVGCSVFNGWTYDPDNVSAQIGVHFYADGDASSGIFLGNSIANILRSDVNQNTGVSGDHGFSFSIPAVLQDGGTHTIYAYGINSDTSTNLNNSLLTNSPLSLTGCTSSVVPPVISPPSIPAPTWVTPLTASPSTLTAGQTSILTWSANNSTSCTASGDWSGVQATSGSVVVPPISSNKAYSLTCTGPGGGITSIAPITFSADTVVFPPVTPAPVFTTPLTSTPSIVTTGQTSILTWSATNSTTCTASGGWTGAKPTSGSFVVGPIGITTVYNLSCVGAGGTINSSATITYSSGSGGGGSGVILTAPTWATPLTASPSILTAGQTSILTWSATNSTTCTASGGWTGIKDPAGSTSVGPITVTTVYNLSCTGAGGSTSSSVTVTYNAGGGGGGGLPLVGVNVVPTSGLTTSEIGTQVTFTVVLNSQPSANVVIPVTSSDLTEGTILVLSPTFTSANWNVPQVITVTGVNDSIVDGTIPYTIILGQATSADTNYNNFNPQDVSVSNLDDEISLGAGYLVTPAGPLVTTEGGSPVTFTFALTSVPASQVDVSVLSSNFLEGTTSPFIYTFTTSNWNTPQTVTVTPVDDTIVDGPINYNITILSASADSFYNNVSRTIQVTNNDNDSTPVVPPAVIVPSTGGGSGGGSGSSSSGGRRRPVVNPATVPADVLILFDNPTTGIVSQGVCKYDEFITQFMKKGIDNNPEEVKKLQHFLKNYEAIDVGEDGVFDDKTEDAVRVFQLRYTEDILAPWGISTSTGIVYITTTLKINTIFCGANPEYRSGNTLKDINPDNVLENATSTLQFEGDMGINVPTTTSSFNMAGIIGALFGPLGDFLKDIPLYALLMTILLLLGTTLIIESIILKDKIKDPMWTLVKGLGVFLIGSVLNILNTLSFYMVNSSWFSENVNLDQNWILGFDVLNLILVVIICMTVLVSIYFHPTVNYPRFPKKLIS